MAFGSLLACFTSLPFASQILDMCHLGRESSLLRLSGLEALGDPEGD